MTPYVAEQFPQGFKEGSCAVKVLSAERTFWEKATILHAEFHRPADKAIPERFSRHYCDFYELIRKGVAGSAVEKPELLARVAEHKSLFFRSASAKYGEAVRGTLRIVPPEHRLKPLRDDYGKMQQMFFGEPDQRKPPLFTSTNLRLRVNSATCTRRLPRFSITVCCFTTSARRKRRLRSPLPPCPCLNACPRRMLSKCGALWRNGSQHKMLSTFRH